MHLEFVEGFSRDHLKTADALAARLITALSDVCVRSLLQ